MDLRAHLVRLVSQTQKRRKASKQAADDHQEKQKQQFKAAMKHQFSGQQVSSCFSASRGAQKRRQGRTEVKRRAPAKLIVLNWTARLSIILIGTCILFSLFFGLEFLIGKLPNLFSLVAATEASKLASSYNNCPSNSISNWSSPTAALLEQNYDRQQTTGSYQNRGERQSRSKLGVDLDEHYEDDLELSSDKNYFLIKGNKLPLQFDIKLRRMLESYHVAMPFNPDIWSISDPHEELELLSGDLAKCSRQLEEILDLTEEENFRRSPLTQLGLRSYKLNQLLDSFGRPEAGTFLAHPFWLGSYLECKRVGAQEARWPIELSDGELETRYCIGKWTLKSWRRDFEEAVALRVGLCLPKACDSMVLFEEFAKQNGQHSNGSYYALMERMRAQVERLTLINFSERIYPSGQLQLRDIYCQPLDERRKLGATAFLLLFALSCWLFAGLFCTWLRWRRDLRPKDDGEKNGDEIRLVDLPELSKELVDTLAIDANFKYFVFGESSASKDDRVKPPEDSSRAIVRLEMLDSVKHLCCAGVLAGHVLLTYLALGSFHAYTLDSVGKDMRTMLLLALNNFVDTFFVIAGLLVAYLTFKRLPDKKSAGSGVGASKWSQYFALLAGRYLRMAPLYFLVFSWAKLISSHLGSGPLWDYTTNKQSLRGKCRNENWLWALAFASDFKPLPDHCIPPAWSIAVDLKFFIILPIFIALLRRSKRLGYTVLSMLVVVSTIYSWRSYNALLDFVSLEDLAKLRVHVSPVLIRYAAEAYSQIQNRIGPILVGLIGGHMLHEYERTAKNGNRKQWPRWMRGRYFQLVLVCSAFCMVTPCLVQLRERFRPIMQAAIKTEEDNQVERLVKVFLSKLFLFDASIETDSNLALAGLVLVKPVWAFCNCVIFLRLATDLKETLISRLMSLGFWGKLSKLNYAILLIHFEFIAFGAMSRLALEPITWIYLVSKFCFTYVCSLLMAMPLYVLVEQPLSRLTSRWLSKQLQQVHQQIIIVKERGRESAKEE